MAPAATAVVGALLYYSAYVLDRSYLSRFGLSPAMFGTSAPDIPAIALPALLFGEPVLENPNVGEVIWRDDVGVTCRRWNWRQGTRTRLDGNSRRMWFVLESLDAMPIQVLEDAGTFLRDGLRAIYPEGAIWRGPLPTP